METIGRTKTREAGLNRLLSRGLRPDGFSFGPVIRGLWRLKIAVLSG